MIQFENFTTPMNKNDKRRSKKTELAEIRRKAEEDRRKRLEEEGKRRLAREPNKTRMTDTEYAIWHAESKQSQKLQKPTRRDPVDQRTIGWSK